MVSAPNNSVSQVDADIPPLFIETSRFIDYILHDPRTRSMRISERLPCVMTAQHIYIDLCWGGKGAIDLHVKLLHTESNRNSYKAK